MTQEPTGRARLTREKRTTAARAIRLAQTLVGLDREQLLEFAAELEREAEALETRQISISVPPVVEPQAGHRGGFHRPLSDQASRGPEKK